MINSSRLLPTIESLWRIDANALWDDFESISSLNLDSSIDVLIIGLGGAGLSAAKYAAERGLNVVGLEAGNLGRGAAGSNGGFLLCGAAKFYNDAVQSLGESAAAQIWRMTKEELELQADKWPDVVKQTGTRRSVGWPYVDRALQPEDYDHEVGHLRGHYDALKQSGMPVEFSIFGGTPSILIKDDGWCQPAHRLQKACEEAKLAGAQLFFNTPAYLDTHDLNTTVLTAVGRLKPKSILVSTDAHLEELFPELKNEVTTWKLQMINVICDNSRFDIPTYMRYGYDYVAKTANGLSLGGFRDHELGTEIATAWTGSAAVNDRITKRLVQLASLIVEEDVLLDNVWSSAVSYTVNSLPIIREIRKNVWACGAYSGHGNLLSFICGRSAIDAIISRKSLVVDMFSVLK